MIEVLQHPLVQECTKLVTTKIELVHNCTYDSNEIILDDNILYFTNDYYNYTVADIKYHITTQNITVSTAQENIIFEYDQIPNDLCKKYNISCKHDNIFLANLVLIKNGQAKDVYFSLSFILSTKDNKYAIYGSKYDHTLYTPYYNYNKSTNRFSFKKITINNLFLQYLSINYAMLSFTFSSRLNENIDNYFTINYTHNKIKKLVLISCYKNVILYKTKVLLLNAVLQVKVTRLCDNINCQQVDNKKIIAYNIKNSITETDKLKLNITSNVLACINDIEKYIVNYHITSFKIPSLDNIILNNLKYLYQWIQTLNK